MLGAIVNWSEVPAGLHVISVKISGTSGEIRASTKSSMVWKVPDSTTKLIKTSLNWLNLSAKRPGTLIEN